LNKTLIAYPHPLIAREGWPYVIMTSALATLVMIFAGWWSIPFWLVALFVLQFFRDPPRRLPLDPNLIVAPADGRVVAVERVRDPYAARESIKISIFMNVFNVHSNRSPVDGEINSVTYFPGSFLNADLDKASTENERNAIVARTASGELVTFVQVAGLIARRILCYVKPGDHLTRGQRYGFIRFGSRVDVYLPPEVRVLASVGQKVKASSSVIAEF